MVGCVRHGCCRPDDCGDDSRFHHQAAFAEEHTLASRCHFACAGAWEGSRPHPDERRRLFYPIASSVRAGVPRYRSSRLHDSHAWTGSCCSCAFRGDVRWSDCFCFVYTMKPSNCCTSTRCPQFFMEPGGRGAAELAQRASIEGAGEQFGNRKIADLA